MYVIESYVDGVATIVNDVENYRCPFRAETLEAAGAIVVSLNRPVLMVELAGYRLDFETRGLTTAGGLSIKTDRESQAQLNSAFTTLKYGLIPDTDWKGGNDWEVVNLDQIEPIAKLVAAHVRACFRGERLTQRAIAAAVTVEDIDSINIAKTFGAAYAVAFAEVMQPAGA
ncbi:DUF4376 domain-containing protein [Pseudomonas gessardii]|uniref:DUF4376 domain-containing protein n=1 Tax=Pseudomonas gessardii TaxID=78544 RepID=A0ABS9FCK1_9PSED|nr:DUF4376 domain-containing protein [Pseudomonas gessardii]MCF4980755.1 DUF4376 domain-containing protein [Pseudomonas gessardii]MCF4988474.1 DUF4376 domain-containing protein [Pseudomonas gessardii]MCF5097495.1 DUF4376 domain-containing protein [Pseudomonas gessardii]MCF5109676.1 DUF4376 domain-containing protein [Pseudomonas gessardii]